MFMSGNLEGFAKSKRPGLTFIFELEAIAEVLMVIACVALVLERKCYIQQDKQ